MALKRHSGDGSSSRRFAEVMKDGEVVKLPVVKDTGTIIYLTNNGQWVKNPLAVIPADIDWLVEGHTFFIEDLTPGHMGKRTQVRVVDVVNSLQIIRRKGKYAMLGQAKRNVLVQEISDKYGEGTTS
jgi:hypothetical protein